MKRTKSMIHTPSDEARELFVYAVNDSQTYHYIKESLIPNFRKHYKKGMYDPNKAVDAYYRAATMASNNYNKDFGYKFSVTERFTAAVDMEKDFREDVIEEDV